MRAPSISKASSRCKPDLIVTWPYLAPAQLERLRAMGVPVYLSNPATPMAIADEIERLGRADGAAESAARRRREVSRTKLVAARDRAAGTARVRVFYEIWNRPLYTVGGGHLITAAIEMCGGENVFASLPLPAPQVSVEAVLAAAPEAIVAGADDAVRPRGSTNGGRGAICPRSHAAICSSSTRISCIAPARVSSRASSRSAGCLAAARANRSGRSR